MKAMLIRRYGGPEVFEPGDVPAPRPGPGEILVRVRASSVNPVDTAIRSGMLRLSGSAGTAGTQGGAGGGGNTGGSCEIGRPTWSCAPAVVTGPCCDANGLRDPQCSSTCNLEEDPEGAPCEAPGKTTSHAVVAGVSNLRHDLP